MKISQVVRELQDIKRRTGKDLDVVIRGDGIINTIWVETENDEDYVELS